MIKKRVTQLDIAREANVSQELVSVVLNGKDNDNKRCRQDVQDRIREIAAKYNYRTNRSAMLMKKQRHGSIGVMVRIFTQIQSHLFSKMLSAAKNQDYALLLEQLPTNNDKSKMMLLDDSIVDGLIIFNEMPSEVMDRINKIQEPVLYFNTEKREGSNVITVDDEAAGYLAAKSLGEAGLKKLAYISWVYGSTTHYSAPARKAGVERYCKEHSAELVLDFNIEMRNDKALDYKPIRDYILERLKDKDIDGIILQKDEIAPALYSAANILGKKIPEDYSVISFNNNEISYALDPKLTSFGFDNVSAAELIIDRMVDLIEGKKNLETIKLPLVLFDGDSVKTINK
jgi:LacI family transcriptional regulator